MKAAFIHDHHFVFNNTDKKYYDGSGGVFTRKLWNRYLDVFESLIVVGREVKKLPNTLVESSCENVSFDLIRDLQSNKDRFLKAKTIESKITSILKNVDFAIIRVPSTLGYIAQKICVKLGIKYVLEVVGCPWDAYVNHSDFRGKLIAPFEYLKLKRATKKSLNTIYVTQYFLQERYPTKGKSIGISNVNINEIITSSNYSELPDIFKLGLIGSFHVRYKGHIEAIRSLKRIKDLNQIPKIKLYLVGTGDPSWIVEYAKRLGVSDIIEVIGVVEAGDKGVFPFLDMIDLYIHPSKQEGLPRVVVEALSRGKLVLGSSVAGLPELLEEKYLHKPGDWLKLSEDIIRMYEDFANWEFISTQNNYRASFYLESRLQANRVRFLRESYV